MAPELKDPKAYLKLLGIVLIPVAFGIGYGLAKVALAGPDYDQMKRSTLSLELDDAYICSAVAVEKDVAVTAGHCVQKDGLYTVVTPNGKEFEVEVGENKTPFKQQRGGDELIGTDIAVLHLKPTEGHPAQDGKEFPYWSTVDPVCEPVDLGTDVFVAGSPSDGAGGQIIRAITRGEVITTEPRRDVTDADAWLQHDAVAFKGNSGGPVFNRAGDLIGITSHGNVTRIGIPGHNFAVSGPVICQVLE